MLFSGNEMEIHRNNSNSGTITALWQFILPFGGKFPSTHLILSLNLNRSDHS